MVNAVARTIVALLLAAVVTLVISPLAWTAGAQPESRSGRALAATTAFSLLPTVPLSTVAPTATTPATTTARRPTTVRPRSTATVSAASSTSTTPTTAAPTTVAPIPGVAPPPVTLPLATDRQSAHVSPVFPILGGMGIFALIALLATQWYLTQPGRRGPTL